MCLTPAPVNAHGVELHDCASLLSTAAATIKCMRQALARVQAASASRDGAVLQRPRRVPFSPLAIRATVGTINEAAACMKALAILMRALPMSRRDTLTGSTHVRRFRVQWDAAELDETALALCGKAGEGRGGEGRVQYCAIVLCQATISHLGLLCCCWCVQRSLKRT